jgi:MFS family permease
VVAGYGLSSLVRPAIGLAVAWPQVLALRFVDRVGKGARGAPRDALLASVAAPDQRARVFGLHRAMDHAGAVAGPLLASVFLWRAPGRYRALFLSTIVPGLVVLLLLGRLPKDPVRTAAGRGATQSARTPDAERAPTWRRLPPSFFRLLLVLFVFTLGNSTDAYLLLRLSDLGVPVTAVPLLWAALHVVKAGASLGGGWFADRYGRRRTIVGGWLVYGAVYAGFASSASAAITVTLFLVYGLYYGLTEGAEKALIADVTPSELRATAFGAYGAVLGFGSLAASLLFGVIWESAGPAAAFLTGAGLSLASAVALPVAVPRAPRPGQPADIY